MKITQLSDDIAALLGAMQFFADNSTIDLAIWYDWQDAFLQTVADGEDYREYIQLTK